jgi:hypothetical protein
MQDTVVGDVHDTRRKGLYPSTRTRENGVCSRTVEYIMGTTGFDVVLQNAVQRPELLRLSKRGNNTTANQQFALAA